MLRALSFLRLRSELESGPGPGDMQTHVRGPRHCSTSLSLQMGMGVVGQISPTLFRLSHTRRAAV